VAQLGVPTRRADHGADPWYDATVVRSVAGLLVVALPLAAGCGGAKETSTPDSGTAPEGGASVSCPSRGNGKATNTNFTYGAPMEIALPNGTMGQSAAIGDVTGDGRNDVVVGTYDSAALFVLPQTASGQLGPAVTYDNVNVAAGGTVNQYTAAYVTTLGDLNGDGRLDVVIARFTDVAVLYQNAAGGLEPPVALAVSDVASGVHAVAVADLDGDGRDDIVSASWMADNLDVFYQRPDGTMAPVTPFPCPHHGNESLATGDIDGDGATDIVVSGEWDGFCVLYQRPGGFASPTVVDLPANPAGGGIGTGGVGVGDFGLADCRGAIAYTTGGNSPTGKLGLLVPIAGGGFQAPMLFDSYDIPGDVVVADIDGDGRPDVVIDHFGWMAVSIYQQMATGGLAAESRFPFSYVNSGPQRLAVGDINGDGRPDIVTADANVTVSLQQ
jgi:hypothetical protein